MKRILSVFAVGAMLLPATVQAGECYVKTVWPSGKPRSGVKLGGHVSYGGMVRNVYTDSNGEATLRWSSDNSLTNIYVNGSDRGPCKNGGSVQFVVK